MIRTDQTSFAPPPLPPRLGRSQPVLIPAQITTRGHNKTGIHILALVVILHLVLSVGGFIYLLREDKTALPEKTPLIEARVGSHPIEHKVSSLTLAHLVIEQRSHKDKKETSPGYLQWEKNQSVRKNINFYKNNWITILESGDYLVYSKVTFSKGHPKVPLASRVMMRTSETSEENVMMKAYCSMSDPHICTATQVELLTLEKGNQLGVWVTDRSFVDYESGATTFGMHKL